MYHSSVDSVRAPVDAPLRTSISYRPLDSLGPNLHIGHQNWQHWLLEKRGGGVDTNMIQDYSWWKAIFEPRRDTGKCISISVKLVLLMSMVNGSTVHPVSHLVPSIVCGLYTISDMCLILFYAARSIYFTIKETSAAFCKNWRFVLGFSPDRSRLYGWRSCCWRALNHSCTVSSAR